MFAAVLGDATDNDTEADADSDASTARIAQNSQHVTNDAANEAHRDARRLQRVHLLREGNPRHVGCISTCTYTRTYTRHMRASTANLAAVR